MIHIVYKLSIFSNKEVITSSNYNIKSTRNRLLSRLLGWVQNCSNQGTFNNYVDKMRKVGGLEKFLFFFQSRKKCKWVGGQKRGKNHKLGYVLLYDILERYFEMIST